MKADGVEYPTERDVVAMRSIDEARIPEYPPVAAVPDPREDIDWTKHRGSCRVFYAERRCTCGAVPDPRFRDQLAEALKAMLTGATGIATRGYWQRRADALLPLIAAEVEARVQAAGDQWAAEVLLAAAQWLNAGPDEGGAPYITNDHTVLFPDKLEIAQVVSWACASLRDRAAALTSPAPAPQTGGGQ